MSKKAVVLGGTGFIGSAIVRGCLRAGWSCVPLGSQDCDLTDLNSCTEKLPAMFDGNTVVYAAGIPRSRSDTEDALKANLAMVRNTVLAIRKARPSRVIFVSSVEVYGLPCHLPITEETEISPVTSYARGKIDAERLLRTYCDDTGVPLAILRLPGIYGPGDGGNSVVGKLVQCVRRGQPFQLAGDGSWRRDYVWVDDVARVVTALMGEGLAELTVNVATGHSLSIRETIDRVSALYGPVPLENAPEAGGDAHLDFDVSQFRALLPGLELTVLDEGLKAYGELKHV